MKYDIQLLQKLFLIKSRDRRKAAFLSLTDKEIDILSEIVHNLLQGKVTLLEETKKKLKKKADWIRKFANKDLAKQRKRTLLFNHPTIYTFVFRVLLPMALDYFNLKEK